MIDIRSERLYPLTQAAKLKVFGRRRGGKRIHVSTLFRWSTVGCKGVRLETIQAGGCRATSVEAVERFFRRLTEAAGTPSGTRRRTPARRRKAAERALRELAREGV